MEQKNIVITIISYNKKKNKNKMALSFNIDPQLEYLINEATEKVNANNKKLGIDVEIAKQYKQYTQKNSKHTQENAKQDPNAQETYTLKKINTQNNVITNYSLTPMKMQYTMSNTGVVSWGGIQSVMPDPTEEIEITPSPNIDMNKEIYQNEFEVSKIVEIGKRGILDQYGNYLGTKFVEIGLIDDVSQDEDDLYAKFPDGEIIPFKGHQDKISLEFETWNNLQRSDLIGNEIKKAAICRIYINNHLGRIIEGTDVQDLLMKADRAIDELKAQPFSICRDSNTLMGREIYYDNQPAIIANIDEVNNLIFIAPDTQFINQFNPPASAIEENESEEWITQFGKGMNICDYDPKIWWWRNANGNRSGISDLKNDPFYGQFPQPIPPLTPPLTPQTFPQLPNTIISPNTNTNPYIVSPNAWTKYNPLDTSIQWTITSNNTNGLPTITSVKGDLNYSKTSLGDTTPRDLDDIINAGNKELDNIEFVEDKDEIKYEETGPYRDPHDWL
jgi:hypothetical protein